MSAAPSSTPVKTPADLPLSALIARIWREYLSDNKAALLTGMACAALAGGLSAALLGLLEPAINGLFVPGGGSVRLFNLVSLTENQALLWIPIAIVGTAMLRTLATSTQARLVNRIGHGIVGDIQVRLFAAMIRADLARLRSQHSGSFVSTVLYDANLVREAFTSGVVSYTQHGLTLIAVLLYMAWIDWRLTAVVLLAIPVVSLVLRTFGKRTRKAAAGAMVESEALSTALMENLDGVRLIKIENREAAEEARVAEVVRRRQRHVIKGANARALAGPASDMVAYCVVAAVITFAGWQARQGVMNVGEFAAFIGLLLAAGQSLRQVTNLSTIMSEGLTAARRLFASLDIQPEIREAADARPLPAGPATVSFDHVSFAYAPSGAPTLSDVSIRVAPGETVALVGPSGGGKSTVLSLLPRFYDVTGGAVTVNGRDVRQLKTADLRDRIALVTQEPFLFDDTIAANIGYGRDGASPGEIEAAARAAAAHDFIAALPQGYETRAGEAGVRLSGGQRQRIAIARAFLKDAPILLLDEATSALDTESEALVQAALERLMQGRATLMIAHRLSTVRNADRIYVLEAGRVVEEGTHDALVGRGGLYSRLARQQSLDSERPTVAVVAWLMRPLRIPAVQATLSFVLAAWMRFCFRTIRWTYENQGVAEEVWAGGGGVLAVFWHSRIGLSPACWPLDRATPAKALISLSPDGQFIAKAVGRQGFPAIHGSTGRKDAPERAKGGAQAFRAALRQLKAGGLAVTPDGPRGPANQMGEGLPLMARLSKVPVLFIGMSCSPAIRLNSWDRAVLPLPFGRGAIVWDRDRFPEGGEMEAVIADWTERLNGVEARADAITGLEAMTPLPLIAYRWLTRMLEPLAPRLLDARVRRGKEDEARVDERLGIATVARPPGDLVWLHGASVGETLSLLPLVERLSRERPDLRLLVTSGTVTSAAILHERLPAGVIHQFPPVDAPGAVDAFLQHWRPALGVFVESELWPNLLLRAQAAGVRLALVSARITQKTADGWARFPRSAARVLDAFDAVLPQDDASAERLRSLGAHVDGLANLKLAGAPLPHDTAAFSRLSAAIGDRPVVLAASTHEDEEVAVVEALFALPGSPCLIVLPRHPERGADVAEALRMRGHQAALRSRGEPMEGSGVYVADTLNEMGLFLRLADVVVLGGSFGPVLGRPALGGHNPLEPARLGKPVITGPDGANWKAVNAAMVEAGGLIQVAGFGDLPRVIAPLLMNPSAAKAMGERARRAATEAASGLDRLWAVLQPLLPPAPARGRL